MNNKKAIYRIGLLSLIHAGIDFLCAFSLYHSFVNEYETFLLYNFCAFALQMPFGILIDILSKNTNKTILPGKIFTLLGIVLTILGSYISYIILGIGNALFHVGAGVLSIHEDDDHDFKGRGLGVFVAPGAIGLILGSLFNQTTSYDMIHLVVSLLMLICALIILIDQEERELLVKGRKFIKDDKDLLFIILGCFIVVIIRSLTGLAISFSWKNTAFITFVSVLALALGKAVGGLLCARIGMKKTVIITLIISTITYFFADNMYCGLLALFFFNMTMPMTLYLLVQNMSDMPGFAFGILTFGLFLGYLPVLYGYISNASPKILGTTNSFLSLIILFIIVSISERRIHD